MVRQQPVGLRIVGSAFPAGSEFPGNLGVEQRRVQQTSADCPAYRIEMRIDLQQVARSKFGAALE